MRRLVSSLPLIFLLLTPSVGAEVSNQGCSMRDVMTCVVQLKSYNVPIDTNMMNVVFNVSTEAKLVHVCRAYNNAMPCFKQRLATCANEKQRIRLAEVDRLLLFICAPFSLQRQKTLLKVGKCIGEVLKHPIEPGCPSTKHRFGHKLRLCRDNCDSNDVVCLMRVRMSELAVCSVIAIEKECGRQAADFYAYMQTAIIGEEFPIQCKYDFAAHKIKEILSSQEFYASAAVSREDGLTSAPPSHIVVQDIVLPKPKISKGSKEAVQLSSEELTKAAKLVAGYNYTKKALKLFQNDRKKPTMMSAESNESDEVAAQKGRAKNIRTRNYSKLFRPAKFAEINLKKYQPPENTVIVQLFPKESSRENKPSEEKSNELPAFLQGARPIPDSSIARPIILPKTSYLNKDWGSREKKLFDSEEKPFSTVSMLAGVQESYTPKIDTNERKTSEMTTTLPITITTTTTTMPTTMSTTISSTAMSPTTTSDAFISATSPAPIIITFTDVIPVTTTQKNFAFETTTPNKFIPWYYNTLNKQVNDTLVVTTNPMFPYFNPRTLSQLPKPLSVDPYYSRSVNTFNPDQFAANFVSRINASSQFMNMLTTTTPSTSNDIAKLLNMPDFKEKADTILSTAIDVLKPHNKYQQPFADAPDNNLSPLPPSNKTASGAFTELMDTIKKISPTVLDNIREKLNSLGHN